MKTLMGYARTGSASVAGFYFPCRPVRAGIIAGLALGFFIFSSAISIAADGGRIVLTSIIEKEVLVKDKDGKEKLERMEAGKVKNVPGDEIIISVNYENTGKSESREVVINNPIPGGTVYKAGSAEGASSMILLSADGGRTFESEGKVSIIGTDGRVRKALPEEITNIKWTITKEIKPEEMGSVSFRAIIKK